MSLLGGIGSALGGLFKDTPGGMSASDKLTLIGSALMDFSGGEGPKYTTLAQKDIRTGVEERQKGAAMDQITKILMGGGGGDPTVTPPPAAPSIMKGPGLDGSPIGQAVNTPPFAPTSLPQAGPMSINDPRMLPLVLAATRGGVNLSSALDVMKAQQPDMEVANGVTFDRHRTPPGSKIGVNLSNINGFAVDNQDPANAGRFFPKVADGATPLFDGQGNVVAQRLLDGTVQAMEQSAEAGQRGQTMGTVFNRPNGDGSTTPTLGRDMGFGGGAQGGSGAPGVPGGSMRTLSPGEQEAQKVDFQSGAQAIAGAQDAGIKAQNTARNYQQAVDDALQLDPNNMTGFKLGTAKILRSLGVENPKLEQFTNTAEGYRMLTTQMVLPLAKELGSNPSNRDAQIIQNSMPGIRTPRQTAVVMFAQQAALQNKEAARQNFFANYDGPQSKSAMQRAWSQSPEAKKSIFQDPTFSKFTIDGQPAVVYKQKAGKTYGVYMPFNRDGSVNSRAQVFEAQ